MEVTDPVTSVPLIGPAQSDKLTRLGIQSVKDLLFHIPSKYRDTSEVITIQELKQEKEGTILAQVTSIKTIYTRFGKTLVRAEVKDMTDSIIIVWFNQPYLAKNIIVGETYLFEGKIPDKPGAADLSSPSYEKFTGDTKTQTHLGKITPFYPETAGISSKWLRSRLAYLIKQNTQTKLKDLLPSDIIESRDLLPLSQSIKLIHQPSNIEDIEHARKRLAIDEMLALSINLEIEKQTRIKSAAPEIKSSKKTLIEFIKTLKFTLTSDQDQAIKEILEDMHKTIPMRRLLNGDVGSGKTVVAAAAAYIATKAGFTTIIMAPTTILAEQHHKTFTDLLGKFEIKIQLLKGKQLLEPSALPQIIIGTHALLYSDYIPSDLGLLIVDEQHRFGVEQRHKLLHLNIDRQPHYLTMTATPIPRTLTNIIYGDTEISVIKAMPAKRIPIKSFFVPIEKRMECLKWLKDHLEQSNFTEQAFIIFPLVDESEKLDAKAVTKEFDELSKTIFKGIKTGLLHGRLKDEEKNQVLTSFRDKEFHILFATSVIEVGIDIPSASIIVIEDAERFGLAQLHQLRGRVGRGVLESYCYVIGSKSLNSSTKGRERLEYFCSHSSGFDVAEYDLQTRGPGEVYGVKQSGIPTFKVASLSDLETFTTCKEIAKILLNTKTPEQLEEITSNLFK